MPMTKVRTDVHGPYVVTNGAYYRPILPNGHNHVPGARKGDTTFAVGSTVKVRALSGSQLCQVRAGDDVEHWFAHGETGTWQNGFRTPVPSTQAHMPASADWTNALLQTARAPSNEDARKAAIGRLGIRPAAIRRVV